MKLTLYQPPGRPWGMPNFSPFCAKLECYLRMARIEHDVKPADIRAAPKGKIPYVDLDGTKIGDSQLIIDLLEARVGDPLDGHLSTEQRAIGHSVRRMLEEGLYFVSMRTRWIDPGGYAVLAPEFAKQLPAIVRGIAMPLIRRSVRATLYKQGTGRHTADEAFAMGRADLDALGAILGEKPYLLGDRPTSHDASVYAFCEGILSFPYDSPIRAHASSKSNLVAYRARMRARYFADLQPIAGTLSSDTARAT